MGKASVWHVNVSQEGRVYMQYYRQETIDVTRADEWRLFNKYYRQNRGVCMGRN